jgi:hypothetical protein
MIQQECLSVKLVSQPLISGASCGDRLLTSSAPFVNIPFQKNSAFVGQQEVLEQLAAVFHGSHNTRQIALYGLGGIG